MTKALTKLPEPWRHRLWAELAGDSALPSLRIGALGWVPRKRERVARVVRWHAFCFLKSGGGTFLEEGSAEPREVRAPGVFFTADGRRHDYGPRRGDAWEECYWTVDGARLDEWKRAGWWPEAPRFRPVSAERAEALAALFEETRAALERRDRAALDGAKLGLERTLHALAAEAGAARSVDADARATAEAAAGDWRGRLAAVVEAWRRAPARGWSLERAAADTGLSYTRFRARFVEVYGTSPYDYLLRLRLELAARWLASTDEPVKAVAARCGFGRVESFVRAFAAVHGASPGRWRDATR